MFFTLYVSASPHPTNSFLRDPNIYGLHDFFPTPLYPTFPNTPTTVRRVCAISLVEFLDLDGLETF